MMKIMALAMTLLVGSIAFGQEPATTKPATTKQRATPEDRATRLTEQMKKELLLTQDQAAKVADINLKIAQKNEGIRTNPKFSPEQKKEAHDSNEVARKAQLKEVLTPEQYKRYEEKEAKREIRKEQRHEEMKSAPAKKAEPKTEE